MTLKTGIKADENDIKTKLKTFERLCLCLSLCVCVSVCVYRQTDTHIT